MTAPHTALQANGDTRATDLREGGDRRPPVEAEVTPRVAVEPPAPPQRPFGRRIDCSAEGTDSYWGNARSW